MDGGQGWGGPLRSVAWAERSSSIVSFTLRPSACLRAASCSSCSALAAFSCSAVKEACSIACSAAREASMRPFSSAASRSTRKASFLASAASACSVEYRGGMDGGGGGRERIEGWKEEGDEGFMGGIEQGVKGGI